VEGVLSKFWGKVPRQEFLDAIDRMIGDTLQHVPEIGL
jgi:hypothetical protein